MKGASFLAAALWLSGVATAQAEVVLQTGFESPTFSPGPLAGQDGWRSLGGPGAVSVSTLHPQAGSQAVLINGSGLIAEAAPPGLLGAYASRDFTIQPVAAGTPFVFVQVGVRLDGPSTDTGGGVNDDLISANVAAYDSNGLGIAEMILSSNGNAYGSGPANGYAVAAPAPLRQYHLLGLRLDYLTRTTDYYLDGQRLGTVGFNPDATSTFGGAAFPMLAVDAPTLLNPGLYSASYDTFSIGAETPEPSAAVALLLFAIPASRFARGRRALVVP